MCEARLASARDPYWPQLAHSCTHAALSSRTGCQTSLIQVAKPQVLGFEILAAEVNTTAECAFWQMDMRSMAFEAALVGSTMSNDVFKLYHEAVTG